MVRLFTIGLPFLYLAGTMGFGTMYLSNGGEGVMAAIAFGARWPTYVHIFLGW